MGKREEVHEGPGLGKWVRGARGDRPEEEKATYEWGRGNFNSWMGKVNTTAGGAEGLHSRKGRRTTARIFRNRCFLPMILRTQPAKCVQRESPRGSVGTPGLVRPSLPSLSGAKTHPPSLLPS